MLKFTASLLVLACMFTFGAAWAQDIPVLEGSEKKHANMDSRLAAMYEKTTAKDGLDRPHAATVAGSGSERVQVVLEMISADAPIPQNLGIIVETTYENLVQANVPVRNLEAIASDENVLTVRTPSHPVTTLAMPVMDDSPSDGTNLPYIILAIALPVTAVAFVWSKTRK